jgi:membrane-bound metal-dependent hydrolase YbcI (DUF457 family)
MFNSTHTFVGFAVARIGAEKWAPYATATAVIAANLPDIDSVAGFWGTAAYLDHHRGITHSLIGVPILSLILASVMCFFSGNFWKTYSVALIAMATHPALDYLNPYGLRPFLPFNAKWYYGDAVFILDPYLDTILLLGLIGGWRWEHRKRLVTWASVVLALAYVGFRLEVHARALAEITAYYSKRPDAVKWAVLPRMGDLLRQDQILASPTGVVKSDVCAPCIDTEFASLESAPSSEVVTKASRARSAESLLCFARFPVTRIKELPSGYRVTFLDFRFYRETANTALAAEVTLDNSLRVTKDDLSFVQPID